MYRLVGPKQYPKLMAIFFNLFTRRFVSSKVIIKNPATPCIHTTVWHIIARKQAINDKLQGSMATDLRRGGVVNITKLRKVYHWVCQWLFM